MSTRKPRIQNTYITYCFVVALEREGRIYSVGVQIRSLKYGFTCSPTLSEPIQLKWFPTLVSHKLLFYQWTCVFVLIGEGQEWIHTFFSNDDLSPSFSLVLVTFWFLKDGHCWDTAEQCLKTKTRRTVCRSQHHFLNWQAKVRRGDAGRNI